MIAIIDYGIGNLRSVEKALHHVGAEARLTSDRQKIWSADGVILPGVGAFGACINGLQNAGLAPLVRELAARGRPLLGICVGMQLLFEESEEMGRHQGLGLLPGQVLRFADNQRDATGQRLKVPQIGWNQLWPEGLDRRAAGISLDAQQLGQKEWSDPLLAGVAPGSYAYFVHSYYCQPSDPAHVLATTDYGARYASVVRRDNLWGVQFHPEKSHEVGLRILQNFVAIVESRL